MQKIEGKEISITTKPLVQNSKIKSTTIVLKSTRDNIKTKNIHEMESFDYDHAKAYIINHSNTLFGDHKRVQINILTSKGWRAGKVFDHTTGKYDFYTAKGQYKEAKYEIEDIYAIQILLF